MLTSRITKEENHNLYITIICLVQVEKAPILCNYPNAQKKKTFTSSVSTKSHNEKLRKSALLLRKLHFVMKILLSVCNFL